MMIMTQKYHNKKAFTLVEMLVTMGILMMVLVMISGLANFVSGRIRSVQNKLLNDSIRQSFDFIAQKMYSANDYVDSGVSPYIYGFRYYDHATPATTMAPDVLVIVSSADNRNTDKKCTFFGLNNGSLAMTQNDCSSYITDTTKLTNNLTPAGITVTDFTIDTIQSKMMTSSAKPSDIPKIRVVVKAKSNASSSATTEMDTTFGMDGESVRSIIAATGGTIPPLGN